MTGPTLLCVALVGATILSRSYTGKDPGAPSPR